jgi:hypothetical protein
MLLRAIDLLKHTFSNYYKKMDRIMTTSKTNTNTTAKIELNAIPLFSPSSALFYFPTQDAAYNPPEIKMNLQELSLIEVDPRLNEEHLAYLNYPDKARLSEP